MSANRPHPRAFFTTPLIPAYALADISAST